MPVVPDSKKRIQLWPLKHKPNLLEKKIIVSVISTKNVPNNQSGRLRVKAAGDPGE